MIKHLPTGLLLGCVAVVLAQGPERPRVLATAKPLEELKSFLYGTSPIEPAKLKEAGLVLVSDDRHDFLVDQNLWLSPRIQNATAALNALTKMDTNQPILVRNMPKEAQNYLLKHISGIATTQDGRSLLGLDSEIAISSNLSMVVEVNGKQSRFDWGEALSPEPNSDWKPEPQEATPAQASTPDSSKQHFQLYFPKLVSDSAFWRGYRGLSEILVKQRTLLETQYRQATIAFSKKFFKGKALFLEKDAKGSLDRLPKMFQDEVIKRLRTPGTSPQDVKVLSANQELYFSFKVGSNLISFTPKDLFDLP